jgi:hypothetical protein
MFGVRIIESHIMTEAGEPYEVARTWRERLFSLPWRPLKATRTVVPQVPMRSVIKLANGDLVMHPAIAEEFKHKLMPERSMLFGRDVL